MRRSEAAKEKRGNNRAPLQLRLRFSDGIVETTASGIMDSPLIAQVFRRLLSHQTCSRLRFHPSFHRRPPPTVSARRYYRSSDDTEEDSGATSEWQQRTDLFPPDKLRDYERYPMVTADALRSRRERPKRVKMLARDFIEGRCCLI